MPSVFSVVDFVLCLGSSAQATAPRLCRLQSLAHSYTRIIPAAPIAQRIGPFTRRHVGCNFGEAASERRSLAIVEES